MVAIKEGYMLTINQSILISGNTVSIDMPFNAVLFGTLANSFRIARTESTITAPTPASICFLAKSLSSLIFPHETPTNLHSSTTLLLTCLQVFT